MNESIKEAIAKIRELISDNNADISNIIPVLAGDSESLKPFKDLLNESNIAPILNNRYIFIKTAVQCDSDSHTFWKTIITNLGMGAEYDINNQNIFEPVSKILYDKTFDEEHAQKILNGILKVNSKISTEKWNGTSVKKPIDEIPKHGELAHGIADIEGNRKKLIFYSHIKEALIDWAMKNKWVFGRLSENANSKEPNLGQPVEQKSCFLIIDDLMYEDNWPNVSDDKEKREVYLKEDLIKTFEIINEILPNDNKHKWDIYRFTGNGNGCPFKDAIKNILKDDHCKTISCNLIKDGSANESKELTSFTHILIDWRLMDDDIYSGYQLLRELKDYFNRKITKDNQYIPEMLILSRNNDPVTIQAALEAGASGYIVKDNIGEIPLIVGRAGKPLTVKEKKEMDRLLFDNFSSIMSFPAFVTKSLYLDKWDENKSDLFIKFLSRIPKADLHVHFGTAIPLNICYDLAIISLHRWYCQYCCNDQNQFKQLLEAAALLINKILDALIKKINEEKKNNGISDKFRYFYIEAFKETTSIYEVVTVNNTVKKFSETFKLGEDLIACLIVTGLGIQFGVYKEEYLAERIKEIKEISERLSKIDKSLHDCELLSFYLQDSEKLIEDVGNFYNDASKVNANGIIEIAKILFTQNKSPDPNLEPLSALISIPKEQQENAQGLPKYLGAGDLVGASLLQFTETLLLASYHIPKWAAEQNVWHQELRAGTTGFLKGLKNPTISTKIMMLGLYAGLKAVEDKYLTTSVLITAKRHKDKQDIKDSASLATEFISWSEKCSDTNKFIPKIIGMDLAGIEKGNLPDDLIDYFKESFKSCLMMTVHAGEDESVASVWQAVYSLHALRIGHGLKLNDHMELKRLFKDRQLSVELCPKSNQFTNGYKKNGQNKYIFDDYLNYHIPVTINTDNPLISHRTDSLEMGYPLTDEYIELAKLSDEINKLLILKLIYNGFTHSFLSPEDKMKLINEADREVFNVLSKDFLDIDI